jgi:hypothetical protein
MLDGPAVSGSAQVRASQIMEGIHTSHPNHHTNYTYRVEDGRCILYGNIESIDSGISIESASGWWTRAALVGSDLDAEIASCRATRLSLQLEDVRTNVVCFQEGVSWYTAPSMALLGRSGIFRRAWTGRLRGVGVLAAWKTIV